MDFEQRLIEVYENLGGTDKLDELVLPDPIIKIDTRNTKWTNVKKFLQAIKRPPDHFISFLRIQLDPVEVNQITDKLSDGIILIGKHNIKILSPLLEKYINEYVICNLCKSYNTKIKKNDSTRKFEFKCKDCQASYTLS